jgi:predicted CopG family antitoxin
MAVKTITIDVEAYNRLSAVKNKGESFSRVIKREVRRPRELEEFLRRMDEWPLSEKAVEAVEEHVRFRHRPSNRRR